MPFSITLQLSGDTGPGGNDVFNQPGFTVGSVERIAVPIAGGATEELAILAHPLDTLRLLMIGADAYDNLSFGLNGNAPDTALLTPHIATGVLLAGVGGAGITSVTVTNTGGDGRTVHILLCRDP